MGYGQVEGQLSAELTAQLQRLARRHQLTLNTLIQGAWALLLGDRLLRPGESATCNGCHTAASRQPHGRRDADERRVRHRHEDDAAHECGDHRNVRNVPRGKSHLRPYPSQSELSGGSALFRSTGIERLFRDLQGLAESQRWLPMPVPYTRDDAVAFVAQRIQERAGGARI